jgi:hypothetical protein
VSARVLKAAALVAVAAFAGSAPPAVAADKEWETRAVKDSPEPLVLDPAKAYILIDTDGLQLPVFMHRPSAAEAARWDAKRAEEFAKERAKWAKKHAAWERDAAAYKKSPTGTPPKKPVEPTEANFGFPSYEQAHQFLAGPQNRFNKQGGSRYLQEVPPGTYVFYKNMMACACLGTVEFEAAAGKITTLGLGLPFLEALKNEAKDKRPKTALDLPPGVTTMRLEQTDFTDPRFPAGSVVQAQFKPAGQWPNWGGGEVDRVMAIPGVFRYERDKQVAE